MNTRITYTFPRNTYLHWGAFTFLTTSRGEEELRKFENTRKKFSSVQSKETPFQRKTIALGKHPRGDILVKKGKHLHVSEGQVQRDSLLLRQAAICREITLLFSVHFVKLIQSVLLLCTEPMR